MGFLTGAFLKIYSAKQRIQLQHQLTSVTMRLQQVQRQSGQLQKQLTQMKQMQSNNITAMTNQFLQGATGAGSAAMQSIFTKVQSGQTLTADEQNQMTAYNQASTQAQMQASIFSSTYKNMLETSFQQYEEAQLEPLKNIEEMLTIEKNNIESQIKLVEGQEKAAGDMEKSSQKDFVPEYTGGG